MNKEKFWHLPSKEPPCDTLLFTKKVIHDKRDGDYISYATDYYKGNGIWLMDKYTNSEVYTTPIAEFDVLLWAHIPEDEE